MIEIADIFRSHSTDYIAKNNISPDTFKVINAVQNCRTATLGGHVDECDECGHLRISYNSCRNRHCSKCQGLAKEEWVAARMENLLPVPYFHIVFTIPSELNPLVLDNKKILYNLLFKASSMTLKEVAKDKKYLGALPGFISVLHTWGQNLMDHPHIHCILTGGGLSYDGTKWIHSRKKFLFPVKALSKVFRGKFMYCLINEYQQGHLQFSTKTKNLIPRSSFNKLCHKLKSKDWVVYCKPPLKNPGNVLKYLGRYTHRVAISNKRIVKFKDSKVTFQWKDYSDHDTLKLMTLDAYEFIRRFLLHVLPSGFTRIRYYGLLSARNRKTKLQKSKLLLGVKEKNEHNLKEETWQERLFRLTGHDITKCPFCKKGNMVTKKDIPKAIPSVA